MDYVHHVSAVEALLKTYVANVRVNVVCNIRQAETLRCRPCSSNSARIEINAGYGLRLEEHREVKGEEPEATSDVEDLLRATEILSHLIQEYLTNDDETQEAVQPDDRAIESSNDLDDELIFSEHTLYSSSSNLRPTPPV